MISFVSQNLREFCAFHSPRQIMGCAYTICSYGQISISCTITNGSLCPPSFEQLFRSPEVLFLNFFFHLYWLDAVNCWYSQVFVGFLFSERSNFFLIWYSFPPSCIVFRFSLEAWRIFLCHIPSLCPDRIFSLPVLGFPILFRFWQLVWYRPCALGNRVFLAIYKVCIRLCISWVCGWVVSSLLRIVMVIVHPLDPWNISFWIFASAKLFSLAVNSISQVFIVFSIKFMTSSDILYILI